MKILLLTQVLPFPADSGPKVKTFNVIKYLARNHEVTLVSFTRGDQSSDAQELRKYCREVLCVPIERKLSTEGLALLRSLITGQPWIITRDDRAAFRRAVRQVVESETFDVVHADQLNMAQFAGVVPGARRVVDAHNALWLLYKRMAETLPLGPRRWLLERDWRLLKKYEGRICREFDVVVAVSEEDKSALMEAGADGSKITVIPITVDCDELQPVKPVQPADHILHIGTMYWPPNVDGILWFTREVLPVIRQARPDVVFDVVGARPPEEIQRLSGNGSRINVAGYVDDPTPYLQSAALIVVPLRAGGGMRVKILNAMAQGLPIVSTTIGCEGIAVEDGCHLLVADQPQEFARAVLRLLDEPELARELGRNGRQLVLERYDYRAACRPLEMVYKSNL